MTAGERLVSLSGLSGVSAATHWLTLAAGSTAGEILVDYSGLPTGTAAEHLMTDVVGGFNYIIYARRQCRR